MINVLRKKRFELGLTLDQIFLKTRGRVHPSRLSRFERGILRPSPAERRALASTLGLSEEEICVSAAETSGVSGAEEPK
jgi:transcriptional regulator with XRE-family HTH domain